MERKHNREIIPNARSLRKNMTREEKHLWYDFLRNYNTKIYRQKILGKYIADFYCAKAKLVIEIDGSQHFNDEGEYKDSERTKFLEKYDLMILRIPNNEVNKNFNGVCEYIDSVIKERINGLKDNHSTAEGGPPLLAQERQY
ncbi:MAG: DUF559 domain-containing protein [Clostridia bacterium]|nr:DUF559 domain-containing protein [Clostridia bacterium]